MPIASHAVTGHAVAPRRDALSGLRPGLLHGVFIRILLPDLQGTIRSRPQGKAAEALEPSMEANTAAIWNLPASVSPNDGLAMASAGE